MLWLVAVLQQWVDILTSVPIRFATRYTSAITVVEIVIALNARGICGSNGYRPEKQICSIPTIFMRYLHCPIISMTFLFKNLT